MLDNLVESKSNANNTKRRGGYLITTSVLVFSLFASGILWSLFAKNLEMGSDSMELSSMVAPVPMPADEPPPPEPVKEIKQTTTTAKVESNVPTRQFNIARTDEPFPPKEISTAPMTAKARPNTIFDIGKTDEDPAAVSSGVPQRGDRNATQVIDSKPKESQKIETEDTPPVIAKKVEPKETPKVEVKEVPKVEKPRPPVSGGVLNGKALNLPKPPYPAAAKAVRASGDVNVQVTIDEKGNVISASAVSGHTLLRQVSEQAARGAKFSPTMLGTQAVKVTGLIVYKFAVQ